MSPSQPTETKVHETQADTKQQPTAPTPLMPKDGAQQQQSPTTRNILSSEPTQKFKITSGSHSRYIDGELKTFNVGDTIELTQKEAEGELKSRIAMHGQFEPSFGTLVEDEDAPPQVIIEDKVEPTDVDENDQSQTATREVSSTSSTADLSSKKWEEVADIISQSDDVGFINDAVQSEKQRPQPRRGVLDAAKARLKALEAVDK